MRNFFKRDILQRIRGSYINKMSNLVLPITFEGSDKTYDKLKEHFSHIFDINLPECSSVSKPDKMFSLWLQGIEKAPPIVRKCIDSAEYYADKGGLKHIVLDSKSLSNNIELPTYIYDKYRKDLMNNAHFSDIVRVFLLEKYGGIWADATVLFTDVISDKITTSDFFVFSRPCYTLYRNFNSSPHIMSSWFIKSNKENYLIRKLKIFFEEFWNSEAGG